MAVAPTGAIYKALEFDGVSSRTYGVYITGEAVYNAPERDVEMIAIPGRNGSFALDKGRFENIEVSYPAGIFADAESDFAEAVSDFRNFLCSRNGYVRLQDEYNPNEYRMAVYKSGLEVTPAQLKAGEFNIVFECKPQRWLTSGESEITVGEYQEVAGEDNAPYLFRSSPQFSDEYDTERDEIVGVSVGFNQLVDTTDTSVTVPSGHKYIARINGTWSVGTSNGTALTVDGSNNDMVIDLTLMFGTTIADYIYSLGTAGSGVAFFKRYFGDDYYPYDSGSIRSVEGLVSHTMRDENDNIIGEYPLDSTVTLRGLLKLEDGKLKADGDVYKADGSVTRKYKEIDFPDNWSVNALDDNQWFITTTINDIVDLATNTDTSIRAISNRIIGLSGYGVLQTPRANMTMGVISSKRIFLVASKSDFTSTSELVIWARNNNVKILYELATPTTDTAQPFAKNQKVSPSGTEEYVTTSVVPVGHETQYGQDPNVIVNPTLFKTSPLIECKGTGNIYLNSDQITINNLPIGDVSLASAKSSSTDSVSSSFNIDNAALLNPGDTITVASGCSTEVSFSWASSVALQSITPTISGTLPGGQVYGSLLSTTSLKCTTTMGAATFAYGTSSYYESTVSVAFEYLQSGTTYTKTCTYKVSCSYDGVNTITLSITNKTGASPFSFTSASACSLKAIKGTSTRLTTTDTIYIDLDIGEAYIINSGTITSINDIVSIPSRLPTLKPGTNTITYANTITNLKITPRWWKV